MTSTGSYSTHYTEAKRMLAGASEMAKEYGDALAAGTPEDAAGNRALGNVLATALVHPTLALAEATRTATR